MTDRLQCPAGLIVVVRAASNQEALTICRGLVAAGASTIEVTQTVPNAAGVIRTLAEEVKVNLGAGTIRAADDVDRMVDAGARFIVSPNTNSAVIDRAERLGVPMVPGALTPTEIEGAWNLGVAAVKVFPVGSVGGADYIKSIREPLPDVQLVVSGGIAVGDALRFVALGCRSVCVGSALIDRQAAKNLDVEGIRRFAAPLLETLTV